jgi:hypothetical protein
MVRCCGQMIPFKLETATTRSMLERVQMLFTGVPSGKSFPDVNIIALFKGARHSGVQTPPRCHALPYLIQMKIAIKLTIELKVAIAIFLS